MPVPGARGPGERVPLEMSGLGVNILPRKFQAISTTFLPSKCQASISWWYLLIKWAALTLKLSTQHCAQGSHLHIPHQNSTSTRFSTVCEVMSYSTLSVMAVKMWECFRSLILTKVIIREKRTGCSHPMLIKFVTPCTDLSTSGI